MEASSASSDLTIRVQVDGQRDTVDGVILAKYTPCNWSISRRLHKPELSTVLETGNKGLRMPELNLESAGEGQ